MPPHLVVADPFNDDGKVEAVDKLDDGAYIALSPINISHQFALHSRPKRRAGSVHAVSHRDPVAVPGCVRGSREGRGASICLPARKDAAHNCCCKLIQPSHAQGAVMYVQGVTSH